MHQEFKSENWLAGGEWRGGCKIQSDCYRLVALAVYFDYVWVLSLIPQLSTFYFSYQCGLTLVHFILYFVFCSISFYVCYN